MTGRSVRCRVRSRSRGSRTRAATGAHRPRSGGAEIFEFRLAAIRNAGTRLPRLDRSRRHPGTIAQRLALVIRRHTVSIAQIVLRDEMERPAETPVGPPRIQPELTLNVNRVQVQLLAGVGPLRGVPVIVRKPDA